MAKTRVQIFYLNEARKILIANPRYTVIGSQVTTGRFSVDFSFHINPPNNWAYGSHHENCKACVVVTETHHSIRGVLIIVDSFTGRYPLCLFFIVVRAHILNFQPLSL